MLAIELSTPCGQVAVVRGGEVLFEESFTSERSHNSRLYDPLGRALDAASGALDLIAVGTGPGSYTGVRIAIAAAQGVALARSVPVIGWCSLAVPEECEFEEYLAVGDARRGGFYVFFFQWKNPPKAPLLLTEADFHRLLDEKSHLPAITFDPQPPLGLPTIQTCRPSAPKLAHLAATLPAPEITRLTQEPLQPLYVREAFITQAKRPFTT